MSADQDSKRSTLLTVFLAGLVGMFFLGFLILITGGFFLHVALIVGVVGGMAGVHYLLWGKLLTERTAGEREEHLLLERMREEETDKKR
jgi:hypothetical protein